MSQNCRFEPIGHCGMIILCGGRLLDGLKAGLYNRLFSGLIGNTSVLVYPFARPPNEWGVFLSELNTISLTKDADVCWIQADEDLGKRMKQSEGCSAVIIPGGDERLIMQHVTRNELSDLSRSMVLVGSSAGANIFSSRYYSNDRQRIESGLGILPIKTICHYEDGYQHQRALAKLAEDSPFHRPVGLRERELTVFSPANI